jgi:hypothetical protein
VAIDDYKTARSKEGNHDAGSNKHPHVLCLREVNRRAHDPFRKHFWRTILERREKGCTHASGCAVVGQVLCPILL